MNHRSPGAWLPWIVSFGVAIRIRQYAANTSLWHDESFVALNILNTPFNALLGPLDWHEPSPPGFLAVEQLIVGVLGHSEYALRLLPLIAGIAALLAFVVFARRLCRDEAIILWASIFVALSPKLVDHCNQAKHFTLDVLAAMALLSVAWRAWEHPPSRHLVWTWTAIAATAPWFSYASVFIVAATGAMLTVRAAMQWSPTRRRTLVVGNLTVLLSLALLAGPALQQRTTAVVAFWGPAFPDGSDPAHATAWLLRALAALFSHFWQPLGALITICVVLATMATWAERRYAQLAFLWLPIMLTVVAAFLHLWPFGGNQHMAFVAPIVLLLAAHGAEIIRGGLAHWHPRIAVTFVLLLLLPGFGDAFYHLIVPRYRHELRPVIERMQARAEPDDAVIVFDPATFAYYTGHDVRGDLVDTAADSRVWVITPRSTGGVLEPDVQSLLAKLRQRRSQLDAIEVYGAAGYLFGSPR